MRIEERLDDTTKRKLSSLKKKPKKRRPNRKRKQEHLSENDIKRLMGQYDPTYKRVRGSYQQK